MVVADLVPHARCASNHIDILDSGLEAVGLPPVLIGTVGPTVKVAKSDIQIGDIVVGEDHLVLSADQSVDVGAHTPPMDHIIILNWKVDVFVGPVDYLLASANCPPYFFLFLPEVNG